MFIGNYNEINLYFKMDYKCKEDFEMKKNLRLM